MTQNILDKDYSHLEKKKLDYICSEEHQAYNQLKVAMIDYNIGVTIVNAEDPTEEVACLNGPMSPHKDSYDENSYDKVFEFMLNQIEEGTIDSYKLEAFHMKERYGIVYNHYHVVHGIHAQCAFKA